MADHQTNPKNDPSLRDALDAALRGWASRDDLSLGEDEVRSLVEAINLRSEAPAVRRPPLSRSVFYAAAMALAASLLLVVTLGLRRGAPAAANEDLAVAALRDEDFSRQRRLVRGVYDLFGDQLSWLSVAPEGLRLGLDESSEGTEVPGPAWRRFTSLRFVVVRRQSETSPWQTVHELDLLAPPEQLVLVEGVDWPEELQPAPADLRVWSFPLPDGGVAIDMEGNLPVFGSLAGGSRVLQPGQVLAVSEAAVDGWEYRLLHAAEVITNSANSDPGV